MEDYRNVIPLSHEIVMVAGNPFVIEKDTRILYLEDNILLERNTQFLAGYIKEATGTVSYTHLTLPTILLV